MSQLTPQTVLHRIPEIRVRADSSGNTEIFGDDVSLTCGSYGLAVLDVFSQPCSLAEAMRKFQSRIKGAQDSMDLTSTIVQLYNAGVLRDETANTPGIKSTSGGYEAPAIHIDMLRDQIRTSAYLTGIREVVKPNDVVIDLGTGTGVFAIAAAQAGARHVYAIEASSMGTVARELFQANGFGDRITLIQGWSTQVTLPEPADVLISEIIGHEPLAERVLEVTMDAAKRFLKPNARLIPAKVRIWGLPVNIPDAELSKQVFSAACIEEWGSTYKIDFNALARAGERGPHFFFVKPNSARNWDVLGAPILLADLELQFMNHTSLDLVAMGTATASGELNGILIYHELQLGPGTQISTRPTNAPGHRSWHNPVWFLGVPLPLRTGERFEVGYKYRVGGKQSMLTVKPASDS